MVYATDKTPAYTEGVLMKMKAFLKRKNIVFSGKRYGIDALGAMAQGLFCSLLIGTIIRTLGSRIVCLHLNDNNTLFDQHKPPMTGLIDWKDVLSALKETGYEGIYNMELGFDQKHFGPDFEEEEALFAVKVMKNALRRDPETW